MQSDQELPHSRLSFSADLLKKKVRETEAERHTEVRRGSAQAGGKGKRFAGH